VVPTWHFDTVDGAASTQPGHTTDNVGQFNAAIVYSGQLHVFTYDATTGSLRHDFWDAAGWHFETLDGPGSPWPGHTTNAVGSPGTNAVIVYKGQLHVFATERISDPSSSVGYYGDLRHDWWEGGRWHFEILDGKDSGWPGHSTRTLLGDAVLIYAGQLHVFATQSHNTTIEFGLEHDWWDGARWHFETLDGPGSTWPGHTTKTVNEAIATIYNSVPNVFITTGDPTVSLNHDWWDGTRWHFETLDGQGSTYPGHTTQPVGWSTAVAVHNGALNVFTGEIAGVSSQTLRHEWWDGTRWHLDTLDGSGSLWPGHTTNAVGPFNAVAVHNSALYVFTYDFTTGSLRHPWCG
jgi:hypothetical protein